MEVSQNALTTDYGERERLHKMLSEYLITVEDQLFQDKTLYIDGYRFINCSFINCTINILRGTFEFHHCYASGTGQRFFAEDAMKCIQLYTLKFPNLQYSPAFSAKVYDDGSFSIGKGTTIA